MDGEENKPLISLLVSMYNGEKYIRECIESMISQNYKNIEIILVDDGSPDNCYEIAKEYEKNDKRIKVIHQENLGVCVSRNNALNNSSGEYVCVIDQDDIISKDYVRYLYSLIEENDADISLTPKVDKFFKRINNREKKEDRVVVWTAEKAVSEMLYHKIAIGPWNKMIKSKIIKDNNIEFNPDFFNGEGFAFSIECLQAANKVVAGSRKIYHYRVGDPESGASKFNVNHIRSSIRAQQYIKKVLRFNSKLIANSWEFSNWHTHCDALNVIIGCKAERNNKQLYDEIKSFCQKKAICSFRAPISIQQKIRGVLFMINPYIAAKIINRFRIRKFVAVKQ